MRRNIDYIFAAAPEQLIYDQNVMDAAFRCWCALFVMDIHNLEQEIPRIAESLQTTERSVYRWLENLKSCGWLEWKKHKPGAPERFMLITSTAHTQANGKISRIQAIIDNSSSLDPAQRLAQIDQIINESDHSVSQNDKMINSTDQKISDLDESIIPPDRMISSLDHSIRRNDPFVTRNDPLINSQLETAQPNAPNPASSDSSSSNSSFKRRKLLPTTAPTATERWLIEHNIDPRLARTWRTLDLAAVQADYQRRRDLGAGVGAIVEAWKVAPPTAPRPVAQAAPAPALASSDEAHRRAQAIAPEDASPDELDLLISEIYAGASDDQALDYLYTRRWQAAHLPTIRAEVAA